MSIWSNESVRYFCMMALGAVICLSDAPLALAQGQAAQQQAPQQQPLTQQQIQQLVAPIALYPDPLLAQILTASTYPLEVVMAARWSQQNPNVQGAALETAMQNQPWDPSVKGLTSVPQVLAMMNDKLDWTEQLGEAFLAQPNDVQNAIQALRQKAEATGALKSSKEQKVSTIPAPPNTDYAGPPEYIAIEPIEPDYIYVPVYDPMVVYGADYWTPAYTPFFWYPPWWTVGPAFGFGAALFVGPALWYHYNWGHGGYAAVQINTTRYSQFNRVNVTGGQFQSWRFNPAHHGTVPFRNTSLQRQYGHLTGVQGVQTNKSITGIKTNKNVQGIQSSKGIQGVKTNKGIQGIRTGKGVQGIKTNTNVQGIRTSKSVQGIKTNKSIQGIHTNKSVTTIKTVQKPKQAPKGVQKDNIKRTQ